MQHQHQAKISKILISDYPCFMLMVATLVSLGGLVTIPIAFITGPLLLQRISRIKNTIEQGATVEGILASKRLGRGNWNLRYVFTGEDGQAHVVQNMAMPFKIPMNQNDPVQIAYDRREPTLAFLVALYAEPQ